MKLEVGMYVRTNEGNIGKLKKYYLGSNVEPNEYVFENGYCFSEAEYENITKSSFNLIELIEVGDYVNGYEVVDIDIGYDIERDEEVKQLWTNGIIKEREIKEILTKEQLDIEKIIKELAIVCGYLQQEYKKQKELIDKIKETIREKPIDYALGTEVIIEINYLIKEYEDENNNI